MRSGSFIYGKKLSLVKFLFLFLANTIHCSSFYEEFGLFQAGLISASYDQDELTFGFKYDPDPFV